MDDRTRMAPSRTELIKVARQPVADSWKEAESMVAKPGMDYAAAYDAWKVEELKRYRDELKQKNVPNADTAELKPEEYQDHWRQQAILLFGGQKGQCYTCHGTTGLGDGRKRSEPLFDDWNKPKKFREFEPAIAALRENIEKVEQDENLSDDDREQRVADLNRQITRLTNIRHSWQLPEQQQFPRNLRLNRFRFGRAPIDIYRRIHAGIAGTEMPGGGPPAPGQQAKLTPTEIWQLVDYVLLYPYVDSSGRLLPAGRHAPATHHASNAAPAGGAESQ
jgi:mono/diheme cytochrome c family protein